MYKLNRIITYEAFKALNQDERKEYIDSLTKTERREFLKNASKFLGKHFLRNIVPALIAGGVGALTSKDKEIRSLGIANILIGVSGGISKFDPTQIGKNISGKNVIRFGESITEAQRLAWETLSDPTFGVSNISVSNGVATVVKDGVPYYLGFENTNQLSAMILDLKGVEDSETYFSAQKTLELLGNDTVKKESFIKKLWAKTVANKDSIINIARELGLGNKFLDIIGNDNIEPNEKVIVSTGGIFNVGKFFQENLIPIGFLGLGVYYLSKKS